MRTSLALALLVAVGVLAAPGRASADDFPLKDGDTWVMVGDSITAQHLHSNYFEAFCFARYPKLTFRFRNSGVGGDTIPKALARFDWDVAAWKPTVISVELGMNDQGGFPVEKYLANMKELDAKIRSVKARPVYLTASPINNGDTMARLAGNKRLHEYAVALKAFAAEQKTPYADQFHAVIDVWGKNKPRETLLNSLNTLKSLAQDDNLAGVQHLRAFLATQAKEEPSPVSMMGDPVHPGPTGQLMMAAALLKALGAQGFVSSVELGPQGKTEAKGCTVENVKAEGGVVSFDRLDEVLPFPIADQARPVLPLDPTVLELSQYTLKASGLPEERYTVKVNGTAVATLTAKELAAGVNLTAFPKGPIADQGSQVLAAVAAKEGLVGQWRGLSKVAITPEAPADAKAKLAALTQKVEEADAKIREAAKPRKLHFELAPVK